MLIRLEREVGVRMLISLLGGFWIGMRLVKTKVNVKWESKMSGTLLDLVRRESHFTLSEVMLMLVSPDS